jgi:hypothetical protein
MEFRRRFSASDQEVFAQYSGDQNPIHMDSVAARRTKAGFPVVHGIHTLLWCLNEVCRIEPNAPLGELRVNFENFIYVDAFVVADVVQLNETNVRVDVKVNGILAMRLLGKAKAELLSPCGENIELTQTPLAPVALAIGEMEGLEGRLANFPTDVDSARLFPDACRVLGASRVGALASSSFLVGMICPGLHSTFRSLALSVAAKDGALPIMDFRVSGIDARFRMVRMRLSGGGWIGSIVTHVRPEPTVQPSVTDIQPLVGRDEFAGSVAFVVGGSRGLGELTAKILAAGGAKIVLTYAVGLVEAQRVQLDILQCGGQCDILKLDVTRDIAVQLDQQTAMPTHLYYFATPQIFRQKSIGFDKELLGEFLEYYVSGFYEIFHHIRGWNTNVCALYPSSSFIEEKRGEFIEYIVAKAAGEVLCRQINAIHGTRIKVDRLPRLRTDQTAAMQQFDAEDARYVMLQLIRSVQNLQAA